MKTLRKRLLLILAHPLAQVGVGLIMMACGLVEIFADLREVVDDGSAATGAHGVLLFGAMHAAKALLELVEGFEKVEEAEEGADTDRHEVAQASHRAA